MLVLFLGTAVFNGNIVCGLCPPPTSDDDDVEFNPYENDPTTPLYFVNGDQFRTPKTRTQHKPSNNSGASKNSAQHSTGDFCRSPLLSRSAARRAYRERTVVGFSQWANNGGNIVTSSGPAPLTIRVQPASDPSVVSRLLQKEKESVANRKFGRDLSNQKR